MRESGDIVLVVGGGGREHAVIHALSKSPEIAEIHCAPGNGGIAELATCHPKVAATDLDAQVELALKLDCDLVVVTPDDPLALGLVDRLSEVGIRAFGPTAAAAKLESSKVFAKELMRRLNIPTADARICSDIQEAISCLPSCTYPLVIKADGLAQGKGVLICQDYDEAKTAVNNIMEARVFGAAGESILLEEYLTGPEVTVLCFCDGSNLVALPTSRDHKRIGDGDTGLNTGGMGAFAPVAEIDDNLLREIINTIFLPVIREMSRLGTPFQGILYGGLMLTKKGPYVIEFNARFGDPEAQSILPLVKSDLYTLMKACLDGELDRLRLQCSDEFSCVVMMASKGYPGKYQTGFEITGLDDVEQAYVYHSGTKREANKFLTAGGRVLGVSAQGKTLDEAIDKAYLELGKIYFEDCVYRRDIGKT
ncbi:MAG TPA: phosphoribosylamine--glycine ligase [Clostridiaceae bacterium]|nr:phosphoribosylamine--glycine ligase [Clostridiaceae bacterium]